MRAVNARLDEMVKEAERTGSPRIRELARQIRETVSKVRKIENGGNGGT
jgi:ribosome-binding protein aMBF1 (putative translation factor)